MRTRTACLLVISCFGSAAAQSPIGADLLVPLHGAPSDRSGELGTWAGGAGYKARFDGGFRFYPALGRDYPDHLPLAWETRSLTIGGVELVSGTPVEAQASDQRFEYRWGPVTEAYDVRSNGVEQTFVVAGRPSPAGELVVTGRVTTPLSANQQPARHTALMFCGPAGERILEYGAATAIDADGRRFPMTTSYDGESIRLALEESVVDAAVFPLIVDPVISTSVVAPVEEIAIAGSALGSSDPFWVTRTSAIAFTRIMTATDQDPVMYFCYEDFFTPRLVFADLSTAYGCEGISVSSHAVVAGTWPVGVGVAVMYEAVFERRYGSTRTDLLVFQQWSETTDAVNTGFTTVLAAAPGEHFRNPVIGGWSETDGRQIVVYDRSVGSSHHIGATLLTRVGLQLTTTVLANLATTAGEVEPALTRASPDGHWLVCWRSSAQDAIHAKRIDASGLVSLATAQLAHNPNSIHEDPRIAVVRDPQSSTLSYMLTYGTRPIGLGVNAIRARSFTWDGSASPPALGPARTLALGDIYRNQSLGSIADSQYLATFIEHQGTNQRGKAVRIGYSGGIIETFEPLPVGQRPFGLVADGVRASNGIDTFVCAYGAAASGAHPVYGSAIPLPSISYVHTFANSSCATIQDEEWSAALAGSRNFTIRLVSPTSPLLSTCAFGFSLNDISLVPLGMVGCTLLQPIVFSVPGTTVRFSLPDVPLFTGDLYSQWIYTEPGANPLGIVTNRVVHHFVE